MINGEEKFEKSLENLLNEIRICPELLLKKEVDVKNDSRNFQKKTGDAFCVIQDYVSDLRIYIKYLLFDLDATRRENLYYKRLLESKDF